MSVDPAFTQAEVFTLPAPVIPTSEIPLGLDRRAAERTVVSSAAVISNGRLEQSAQITEITPSGASIRVSTKLDFQPTQIRLIDIGVTIPVEVIWCRPGAYQHHFMYGLMFKRLLKSQYQSIRSFIKGLPVVEERRKGDRRKPQTFGISESRRASERRKAFVAYHSFVNGRFRPTSETVFFPRVEALLTDPAKTRATMKGLKGTFPPMQAREFVYASCSQGDGGIYKEAINAAADAFEEMRKLSLSTRLQILRDTRKLLRAKRETMIQLFQLEGHPRKLAEWEFSGMEGGLSEETLGFYKDQMVVRPKGSKGVFLARKPDGIVCVSPPGNAPASNSLTAVLALLGGNCIVVKPPRTQPISTIFLWKEIIFKALEMNGAPRGAINIVVGPYQDVYKSWFDDPRVKDIIYFGTSDRGIQMGKEALGYNKKVILELSGKDPLIVWKDADIGEASSSLTDGFLGSTQICMVPKVAFVHEDAYDEFRDEFLRKIRAIKPTLPSDPDGILSPVLKIPEFFKFLSNALENGGNLLTGGQRLNHFGERDAKGLFLQPTVVEFSDDNPNIAKALCMTEENFFPIIPIVKVTGGKSPAAKRDDIVFEKMISFINENQFGLRVSAWAKSQRFIRRFVRSADNSGLLLINQRHVGFSPYLATHGGLNRTGGPYGEMNYVWQKTTHLQGISLHR